MHTYIQLVIYMYVFMYLYVNAILQPEKPLEIPETTHLRREFDTNRQ